MLAGLALAASAASGGASLTPAEAAAHIGEQAEVCGVVASAKFAERTRGQPTFLNLGQPYPNHVFTALVWGSARASFSYPPESLEGQRICVRGTIAEYRGKPEIIVSGPSQISRSGVTP